MPSSESTQQPHVLVVSDSGDASLQACVASLSGAGARVTSVSDVYTAMAKLALGVDASVVVLDVRTLDDRELSFPRLAGRYRPDVRIVVPLLDGTAERLAAGPTGVRPVDVASIVGSIQTRHLSSLEEILQPETVAALAEQVEDAETALPTAPVDEGEEPETGEPDLGEPEADEQPVPDTNEISPAAALAPDVMSPLRLSTNGGPEAAPPGPSLHDAVRARMAGDDPRRTRRSPPLRPTGEGRKPPLSKEELDALLGDAKPDDKGPRRTAEGGGGGP